MERETRLLLEGQVLSLREECGHSRDMVAESLKNERLVYQMRLNVEMQHKWGFKPFPEAPGIPDEFTGFEAPMQIAPDYVQMRSIQADAVDEFRAQMRQMREKQRAAGN